MLTQHPGGKWRLLVQSRFATSAVFGLTGPERYAVDSGRRLQGCHQPESFQAGECAT